MLSCDENESLGPIAKAVCAHSPGQAVLAEAGALDRELVCSPRSWETLLCRIEAFVIHYPSLLLNSATALHLLGDTCLEGERTAAQPKVRTQAAALLLNIQNAISTAIIREGVARIDPEIPRLMHEWLSDLSASNELAVIEPERLLPALLFFGKSILMVADDGKPPQQWFAVVQATDQLLLSLLQQQIARGPINDSSGGAAEAGKSTRVDQARKDQQLLRTLESALTSSERTAADIFLELSTITKRIGLRTSSPTGGTDSDAC